MQIIMVFEPHFLGKPIFSRKTGYLSYYRLFLGFNFGSIETRNFNYPFMQIIMVFELIFIRKTDLSRFSGF